MSAMDGIIRMLGGVTRSDLVESLDDVITAYRAEEQGWMSLSGTTNRPEPTLVARQHIYARCELYWFSNPLLGQAVNIKTNYTFGRGVQVSHPDEGINDALQKFWKDPRNKAELTGYQAQTDKDHDVQVYGNVFLVAFPQANGTVIIRSIPAAEITDIVTDPDDSQRVLWYKRERTVTSYDFNSEQSVSASDTETRYYQDWRYYLEQEGISGYKVPDDIRTNLPKPPRAKIGKGVIIHLYTNKLSNALFGTSDLYRAIDWAKAHKDQLEDWATIIRAQSSFAWKRKGKSTADVSAAAARLDGTSKESPGARPASVASILHQPPGVDWEPLSVPKGATTSPDDSRQLKLMVAAATGVFEHYFGDPKTGNLATAKSMELPMLKMFEGRQQMWEEFFKDIFEFVLRIHQSKNSSTLMEAKASSPQYNDKLAELVDNVEIVFPPIISKDVVADAQSLILGLSATPGENPLIPPDVAAAYFMSLFGVDDVSAKVQDLQKSWDEDKAARAKMAEKLSASGPNTSDGQAGQGQTPKKGSHPASVMTPSEKNGVPGNIDKLKKVAETLLETAHVLDD